MLSAGDRLQRERLSSRPFGSVPLFLPMRWSVCPAHSVEVSRFLAADAPKGAFLSLSSLLLSPRLPTGMGFFVTHYLH